MKIVKKVDCCIK